MLVCRVVVSAIAGKEGRSLIFSVVVRVVVGRRHDVGVEHMKQCIVVQAGRSSSDESRWHWQEVEEARGESVVVP